MGVASIAVPTSSTSRLIANISMILLFISGASMSASCAGMLATAISHEEIMAVAARNMTTLVTLAAETSTSVIRENFNSR